LDKCQRGGQDEATGVGGGYPDQDNEIAEAVKHAL
jgi:hypothetical protein